MFCVNVDGEFEIILVIEKSGKPRCFKSIDTKTLPVTWEHNKKAQMTSEIYQRWHQNFNSKMQRQNRQVLLLFDNVPSHPKNVNVTIYTSQYDIHASTTKSGNNQDCQTIYRKQLLQSVLAKINKEENAKNVSKCVSVLDAV